MEDISRELEREIAQTKPKPYKQDRKTRIIIIDDFGKMKSGEFFKKLVIGLSITSSVCLVAAVLFFALYTRLSGDAREMKTRLESAETKLEELTREKEVLMARLVIQGDESGTQKTEDGKQAPVIVAAVKSKSKPLKAKNSKLSTPKATPPAAIKPKQPPPVSKPPEKTIEPQLNIPTEKTVVPAMGKMVNIEKFTVVKDGNNGDLLVRFDIRNVSSEPGDVSGRIFTLLKPDNKNSEKWLVVPSSKLKDGIPIERRKGQYFSIAHFKPVKFRIKNKADPDFFKKAAIYIFNSKGDIMVEKLIDITEAQ